MEYFDHIYLPEQVIPALGIQTSGLIQGLYKVQAETPEYALGKVLDTLKTHYMENDEKQQRATLLIDGFIQKYGQENVNTQKLKEALLLFYLIKSVKDFIYTPPKGSPNSPDEIINGFVDFLSFRKAMQQLGGIGIDKITLIPEFTNIRPCFTNYSGNIERMFLSYYGKTNEAYEKLLLRITSLGFSEEEIGNRIIKFLYFDLDYLLHDMVYADFFSFITKDSASYEGRLLNMFDIFVLTHDLRPGENHPDFKKFNAEDLQTLKEYRNYRLREAKRILDKKYKKCCLNFLGGTPQN